MIDPEKTWVIADTHFGHHNIIRFCARPANHEALMIKHWNETIPAMGDVLHLGDLFYGKTPVARASFAHTARFLNGKKRMLRGNHDKQKASFYKDCGFEIIPEFEIRFEGYVVSFGHYPLEGFVPEGRVHVHGHIHNNGYGTIDGSYLPYVARQINVSVEQTQYRPVLIADLLRAHLG